MGPLGYEPNVLTTELLRSLVVVSTSICVRLKSTTSMVGDAVLTKSSVRVAAMLVV
jgi:hypothetical protein